MMLSHPHIQLWYSQPTPCCENHNIFTPSMCGLSVTLLFALPPSTDPIPRLLTPNPIYTPHRPLLPNLDRPSANISVNTSVESVRVRPPEDRSSDTLLLR
ncbi:hypothetical protein EYF80_035288 [Liparis tanakae]|uniref:Uncharacterized protein n=1 Tax=Liparis tanakae TaxID=230148 RepID=A0A4Z2GNX5_9TELE|nr:hypothetical protein EYF80_035288 [Liparis tanakae]